MFIYIDRTTGKASSSQSTLTYAITVPEDFTLSKTTEVQEGDKQKANGQGQLLYYASEEVQTESESYWQKTVVETNEARTVTKTEPREVTNTYTDEEGKEVTTTVTVDEPTEWIDNEPVMIANMVEKTISIVDNPEEFTAEEIIIAKFKNLLEASSCDHILADIFLNEDDINLQDAEHKANTGIAIMQLLPNGQAKTKEITIETSATAFTLLEFITDDGVDIYINDIKVINNQAILPESTDKCTIKFFNTTDKPKLVKSYAIGY
jgi:hypothetical protein